MIDSLHFLAGEVFCFCETFHWFWWDLTCPCLYTFLRLYCKMVKLLTSNKFYRGRFLKTLFSICILWFPRITKKGEHSFDHSFFLITVSHLFIYYLILKTNSKLKRLWGKSDVVLICFSFFLRKSVSGRWPVSLLLNIVLNKQPRTFYFSWWIAVLNLLYVRHTLNYLFTYYGEVSLLKVWQLNLWCDLFSLPSLPFQLLEYKNALFIPI